MYIMFISLPLLIYIFKLYIFNYNLRINLITLDWLNFYKLGGWDFLIIFGAFFIKLPIYLFHVWLPKAHVEAPVYGSCGIYIHKIFLTLKYFCSFCDTKQKLKKDYLKRYVFS